MTEPDLDAARVVFERLLHRVAPEVDLGSVDPEAPIQQALDLDSLDFLHLVSELHDATGLDVPERDYPLLSSVSRFIAYLDAGSTHRPAGSAA